MPACLPPPRRAALHWAPPLRPASVRCWVMIRLIPLLILVIDSQYSYTDSSASHFTPQGALAPCSAPHCTAGLASRALTCTRCCSPWFSLRCCAVPSTPPPAGLPSLPSLPCTTPIFPTTTTSRRARRDCEGHHPHGRLPPLRCGQGGLRHDQGGVGFLFSVGVRLAWAG